MLMHRIAIIGIDDNIKAFAMCGMDAFVVEDEAQAQKLIDRLASQKFAIIFVTESIIKKIPNAISKYKHSTTPSITSIPDLFPKKGQSFASEILSINVKKATGSDIFINDSED